VANAGKKFEEDIKKSISDNLFYYRLRDGTASWGGSDNTRFQQSNICDSILYDSKGKRLLLLELKSHKGKSIPFSCIRDNQLKELLKADIFEGVYPGIVFNFRDVEETYFVSISKVSEYILKGERKSFPLAWVMKNGVKINQYKKRVRYRYDIESFLENFEESESDPVEFKKTSSKKSIKKTNEKLDL